MEKPTRKEIEAAAMELGAKKSAIQKWRQRDLPPKWRLLVSQYFKVDANELSY
jgi:hypothetical protein